jgi:CubicO group peptidase (beta-lactamase class C family)
VRTSFRIDAAEIPRALLWGRWDDTIEVYVNGALAAPVESSYTPGYRYLGLNTATLVPGALNTLAVHVTDFGGVRYLDLAIALNEALTTMPISGFERTPTLAAYATAVRKFMREHGIPGGVLAVMKKDKVVVNRAFGWADKSFTRPMLPDAVMRAVGQEVILTAGAVVTLIDAGIADPITRQKITRDTRVFPLLRAHGLAPLPGRTPVPEIDEVTVGMLLGYTSGISELSGDPGQIYADLGVAPGSPITAEDNVRWVYSMPLARPLGSPPGDGWTGSMVLRHLVHVVTGDLLTFLRTAVFAPVGSSDVFIAYEPLAARNPREPGYLTLEPPFDRSIYLENFTALATTAEAFVRYLRRYHSFWGTPLIDPVTRQWAAVPDNGTHVLVGAVAGSWTVTEQRRHDEVSLALFFNFAGDYGPLFDQLDRITDSLPESAWGL